MGVFRAVDAPPEAARVRRAVGAGDDFGKGDGVGGAVGDVADGAAQVDVEQRGAGGQARVVIDGPERGGVHEAAIDAETGDVTGARPAGDRLEGLQGDGAGRVGGALVHL